MFNKKLWAQKYYRDNKENFAKNKKLFSKRHPTYWRDRKRNRDIALREKVLKFLGSKCCHCGNDDARVLQIDHINGGGRKEASRFNNVSTYYKHILDTQGAGYQLLCANCNWIKRREKNENNRRKEELV